MHTTSWKNVLWGYRHIGALLCLLEKRFLLPDFCYNKTVFSHEKVILSLYGCTCLHEVIMEAQCFENTNLRKNGKLSLV